MSGWRAAVTNDGPGRPAGPATPVERDLRRILWVQGIRAFPYGLGSILLGSVLATQGLSDAQVGLVFTPILAGNAASAQRGGPSGAPGCRPPLAARLLRGPGAA